VGKPIPLFLFPSLVSDVPKQMRGCHCYFPPCALAGPENAAIVTEKKKEKKKDCQGQDNLVQVKVGQHQDLFQIEQKWRTQGQ